MPTRMDTLPARAKSKIDAGERRFLAREERIYRGGRRIIAGEGRIIAMEQRMIARKRRYRPRERRPHVRFAEPVGEVLRVDQSHTLQMASQGNDQLVREGDYAVLLALAVADQNGAVSQSQGLNPQPQCLHQPQPRAVHGTRSTSAIPQGCRNSALTSLTCRTTGNRCGHARTTPLRLQAGVRARPL